MRFSENGFHLEFLPGNIDLGAMVYDVVDMQQQGEIIRRSQPALDELAHGPGGTRGNHDGFQRNAAELCHGIVKGYTAAQQRADLAGAPAKDGDIQIANAIDDVVFMPTDEL